MTYCVALKLEEGIVCLSDTRTNAGVDNISKFRKTFTWSVSEERVLVMMTAGNLAVTQAVIGHLQEDIDAGEAETILTAPSVFRVAELVGEKMRQVMERYGPGLSAAGESALSSIVLAGQRAGGAPRLFQIYSAGNFIEAAEDTPYFQIGEHKYGKPILDRVVTPQTSLNMGVTAALLSMDSTLRSNLSVGMPLDLTVFRADALEFQDSRRIDEKDPQFTQLSERWSQALRDAFDDMVTLRV